MRKDLTFCIMGMALSMVGFGLSLRFDFVIISFAFVIIFAIFVLWFIKIEKQREAEEWKAKRVLSKALNDNEKEFEKVYKAISLKADKFPPEKIKPGSRPSEAYERMVKERDTRAKDKADQSV